MLYRMLMKCSFYRKVVFLLDILQTSTIQVLNSALNASTLRNRVILNNVANIDTPGYKSKEVVFEETLKKALNEKPSEFVGKRTHSKHLPIGKEPLSPNLLSSIIENKNTWIQNNGNNVDVEYEMTKLAENTLWYNALVQQTSGHFAKLREVIKEGR